MKQMTFISAMKDYFGMKSGQTSMEFMGEIKALTAADRDWFKANLPKVGYEIVAA